MADEAKRCERRDASGRRCVLVGWCEHDEWICTFSVPTDAERCGLDFCGSRCLRVRHADLPHWYEGDGYRYATPVELAEDAKPDAAGTCAACEAALEEWAEHNQTDTASRMVFRIGYHSRDAEVAALRAELARLTGAGAEPTEEDARLIPDGEVGNIALCGDTGIGQRVLDYCSDASFRPAAYARTRRAARAAPSCGTGTPSSRAARIASSLSDGPRGLPCRTREMSLGKAPKRRASSFGRQSRRPSSARRAAGRSSGMGSILGDRAPQVKLRRA